MTDTHQPDDTRNAGSAADDLHELADQAAKLSWQVDDERLRHALSRSIGELRDAARSLTSTDDGAPSCAEVDPQLVETIAVLTRQAEALTPFLASFCAEVGQVIARWDDLYDPARPGEEERRQRAGYDRLIDLMAEASNHVLAAADEGYRVTGVAWYDRLTAKRDERHESRRAEATADAREEDPTSVMAPREGPEGVPDGDQAPPWLNLRGILDDATIAELHDLAEEAEQLEAHVAKFAGRAFRTVLRQARAVDGLDMPDGTFEIVDRHSGRERFDDAIERIRDHLAAVTGEKPHHEPDWFAAEVAKGTVPWRRGDSGVLRRRIYDALGQRPMTDEEGAELT